MTDAHYVKLDRGLVSVTGADSQTFLQGLISQDVDRVSSAQAAYGAFLTPQGKYLHDFCLAKMGDRLILDGEQGRGEGTDNAPQTVPIAGPGRTRYG